MTIPQIPEWGGGYTFCGYLHPVAEVIPNPGRTPQAQMLHNHDAVDMPMSEIARVGNIFCLILGGTTWS